LTGKIHPAGPRSGGVRMADAAPQGEITRLLVAWRRGDNDSFDRLFAIVYDDLRRLARRQLRRSGGNRTLSTTALVHEGYLKLVDQAHATIEDRSHFFAVAAKSMRQILIDDARRHLAAKRGGGRHKVQFDEARMPIESEASEVVAIDAVLGRLEVLDPRMVKLVELRYFAGLSVEETAAVMSISPRTVKREWQKARAWLFNELRGEGAQ